MLCYQIIILHSHCLLSPAAVDIGKLTGFFPMWSQGVAAFICWSYHVQILPRWTSVCIEREQEWGFASPSKGEPCLFSELQPCPPPGLSLRDLWCLCVAARLWFWPTHIDEKSHFLIEVQVRKGFPSLIEQKCGLGNIVMVASCL